MSTKPILLQGKIHLTGRDTPSSVHGHLARTRPCPDADPSRSHLNQWLAGTPDESMTSAIGGILGRAGLGATRLRKDATLAFDVILSASREYFYDENGRMNRENLTRFSIAAAEFMRARFPGRVAGAVLHLDETTPHVHVVVVPVMPALDGQPGYRLSGKAWSGPGGPADPALLQEAWERKLAPLGVGPRTKKVDAANAARAGNAARE